MRYWDSSALLPLLVEEPHSADLRRLLRDDASIVTWWASPVELFSAICRRQRAGTLMTAEFSALRLRLTELISAIDVVTPTTGLRNHALRLLHLHPLRAADALQLAAALHWAPDHATDTGFVCLDERLCGAAIKEGFVVVPVA